MLIAHRGIVNNVVKENTIPAFLGAINSFRYVGFELDIYMTKDKEFIVYHDLLLDSKFIWKYNYKELKKKGIVRLEDVLKLKKVVLQILNNELSFKVPHSDLQKVLLVSHYMSKNIIFPDYDNMENNEKDKMHHAYYTLTQKKGVCEGQSEAFMLLVNNPQIKIDCRVLGGYADSNDMESGHNWNILKIKESNYVNKGEYFIYDQTWVNNDDGTMEFKYAFIPVMKLRSSLDGVGGMYNMYEEKLPDDFLEHQLKDAIQREIQAKKVLKVENLEELLDNYNKTK